MKHIFRIITLCVFVAGACSCEEYDLAGLFFGSSPSVNDRFDVSSKYNESRKKAVFSTVGEEYRVYVCTDLHIDGSAEDTERYVNACLNDSKASLFSICLGDLVSGTGNEALAYKALGRINSMPRKVYCAVGNHDLNFGQWEEYIGYWKTASYTFEVRTPAGARDLYICLDSASGTLGTSQLNWLKEVLSNTYLYRNIIVLTHTHFFKKDNSQGHTGNFNLDETYMLLDLFASCGVDYVLSGHDHHYDFTQFRGVSYYTLNAFKDGESVGSYYIATVSDDGLSLEEIKR